MKFCSIIGAEHFRSDGGQQDGMFQTVEATLDNVKSRRVDWGMR